MRQSRNRNRKKTRSSAVTATLVMICSMMTLQTKRRIVVGPLVAVRAFSTNSVESVGKSVAFGPKSSRIFRTKENVSKMLSAMRTAEDEAELSNVEKQLHATTRATSFHADPSSFPTFESIGIRSPALLSRISASLGRRPSAVQAASFAAIASGKIDVTIGAETGSGKTLAYLLPLLDDILLRKAALANDGDSIANLGYDYARAIILVPNKELVNQVIRMAAPLCGGANDCFIEASPASPDLPHTTDPTSEAADPSTIVRLGILPGNINSPNDYRPFRLALTNPLQHAPLDIVVTTPASLGPLALSPKNIHLFADVQTLVMDEADMLLDGGYLRPLNNVLMGFRRADKLLLDNQEEDGDFFAVRKTQHVLVAATLPDMGLRSVEAYVSKKFPDALRITMSGMHNARHYGLHHRTLWIRDPDKSTSDGGHHNWRMSRLVEMLQTNPNDQDTNSENDLDIVDGLKGEKTMVFLNSVEDVDGATNALRRAGIKAVPYHAKIPLEERTENLNQFRRYTVKDNDDSISQGKRIQDDNADAKIVSVLVCTDLASRGLDVPGVTAIVQLQFAGNVVAHLHRMGRCGRAGKKDGRGVIFYGKTEEELVEVVKQAEVQQERMLLKAGDVVDEEEDESHDDRQNDLGKVKKAFSRKRGFTKKKKKLRKVAREEEEELEKSDHNV